MPEITVVVPSYNHARFVERTLRSIFRQSLRPEKLIVIDDGSKDESVAVVERALADCPFPSELIARENRGLCATLNQAFELATGDYFSYLGSDDVLVSTALEQQVSLLKNRPKAVLAFGHAYLIDADDNIVDSTENWTPFADGNMLPLLLKGQIFSSPGVVYRRSALETQRWNEDAILEDYELYLKLSGDGEFARNTNVVGGWRQHGSNVSGDAASMLNEWIAAQDRVAEYLPHSREELDELQQELKFASVANLVRSGRKGEAFRLFRRNIGGATSVRQMLGMMTRLIAPRTFFEANQRRKRRINTEHYGKMPI